MDWFIFNIAWDVDYQDTMPAEIFVSWENGCNTKEEAIDFAAELHGELILYCTCLAE